MLILHFHSFLHVSLIFSFFSIFSFLPIKNILLFPNALIYILIPQKKKKNNNYSSNFLFTVKLLQLTCLELGSSWIINWYFIFLKWSTDYNSTTVASSIDKFWKAAHKNERNKQLVQLMIKNGSSEMHLSLCLSTHKP